MAGYYKPGMTEAEQRALSATLSPAVRAKLLADGLAALPACWTPELQDCANLSKPSAKFNCQAIADGWTGDFNKMETTFEALPRCDAMKSNKPGLGFGTLFLIGLGVVAAGALILKGGR